jgi:inorganic pyrophosphatase
MLNTLPTYDDPSSGSFHVVVESPRGAAVKIKFEPKLGALTFDRPLVSGLTYPFDWGFIPSTQAPDGDPLDAMVFADFGTQSGIVIACHALGVLNVEQNRAGAPGERQRNDRVIAMPVKAPRNHELRSVFDLPPRLRDELSQFFIAVTAFEKKDVKVLGWDGPDAARALIEQTRLK